MLKQIVPLPVLMLYSNLQNAKGFYVFWKEIEKDLRVSIKKVVSYD